MKKIVWFVLVLIISIQAKGDNYQIIKDGPLHEAYVVQEYGTLLLETVPSQPPHKITEQPPKQEDSQSLWIPGYWAWSSKYGQFLWVSGVWRRPPPEHHWIPGYWKKINNGWVWIRGYGAKQKRKISPIFPIHLPIQSMRTWNPFPLL